MTTNGIVLECQGVSHAFGSKPVLHGVNFEIRQGEIVGLVGPSGCGKSTLLRAILGTHPSLTGKVVVHTNGENRVVLEPNRDIGIVYQRYSLFPFLTALENVAFGLLLDKTSIPFRFLRPFKFRRLLKGYRKEAEALLDRLGLADAASFYPSKLSGGMCQRVAIAQALATKPKILLLDEPFGALDEALRESLQKMLLTLYGENLKALHDGEKPPYTILLVTHEISEALYVGDRVIGLSQYWPWQNAGFERCPGATIVYDQVAPVYSPSDIRDYEAFAAQKEQIMQVVFDPRFSQDRSAYINFVEQLRNGKGQGVLADETG